MRDDMQVSARDEVVLQDSDEIRIAGVLNRAAIITTMDDLESIKYTHTPAPMHRQQVEMANRFLDEVIADMWDCQLLHTKQFDSLCMHHYLSLAAELFGMDKSAGAVNIQNKIQDFFTENNTAYAEFLEKEGITSPETGFNSTLYCEKQAALDVKYGTLAAAQGRDATVDIAVFFQASVLADLADTFLSVRDIFEEQVTMQAALRGKGRA